MCIYNRYISLITRLVNNILHILLQLYTVQGFYTASAESFVLHYVCMYEFSLRL